jgi:hypothetical protein
MPTTRLCVALQLLDVLQASAPSRLVWVNSVGSQLVNPPYLGGNSWAPGARECRGVGRCTAVSRRLRVQACMACTRSACGVVWCDVVCAVEATRCAFCAVLRCRH